MNIAFPPSDQCPLRFQAMIRPEKNAILLDQKPISFTLLDHWVEQYCEKLQSLDIKRGQHLGVLTGKPLDTVLLALACLRSGIVFCPINPAFPEAQQQAYSKKINAVCILDSLNITLGKTTGNRELLPIRVNSDECLSLIATSGTSGIPKAVVHSYGNHYFNALGSQTLTPLQGGDAWLLSLPLFHVGGFAIIYRCLLSGATMVIETNRKPLESILSRRQVTHLSLVNTQLFRLLEQGADLYLSGVRYILLGGGIASPLLVEKTLQQGVKLFTTYGMTEMASQVCTGRPEYSHSGVTSGAVLPYREVMVSALSEILVRGESLAEGYYQNGVVKPLVDAEGWYHTGDKGQWLNNQLLVIGRMDNMFISGGENIHPEEIEQALLMIPEIIQAIVVPVTDIEFGQRPFAYVQTVAGNVDEAFTKNQLAGKIARFKIPDKIRPFPPDLINTGIKVNRRFFQQLKHI